MRQVKWVFATTGNPNPQDYHQRESTCGALVWAWDSDERPMGNCSPIGKHAGIYFVDTVKSAVTNWQAFTETEEAGCFYSIDIGRVCYSPTFNAEGKPYVSSTVELTCATRIACEDLPASVQAFARQAIAATA